MRPFALGSNAGEGAGAQVVALGLQAHRFGGAAPGSGGGGAGGKGLLALMRVAPGLRQGCQMLTCTVRVSLVICLFIPLFSHFFLFQRSSGKGTPTSFHLYINALEFNTLCE